MKKPWKSLQPQPCQPFTGYQIAAMMAGICRSVEVRVAARTGIELDDFDAGPEAMKFTVDVPRCTWIRKAISRSSTMKASVDWRTSRATAPDAGAED